MNDFFPHGFGVIGPQEFLAIVAAIVTLALMAGLFGAWIGAYFGGRSGAKRALAAMERDPLTISSAQIDDLRNSLDAIAVEVERISEGQRFTTRLVSERVGQPGTAAQQRHDQPVTPH